jgi:hypothetical protein
MLAAEHRHSDSPLHRSYTIRHLQMSLGIVVTRPFTDSNIGSNLSSLAGAAWLAARLQRELVVDWRGMRQLRDASLNYFTEFFEQPGMLGGVPVQYAPVDGLEYDESPAVPWLSPAEARDLASTERGGIPAVVVLQAYHGLDRVHSGPESARFRFLRAFYRELRPAERIAQLVDRWATDNLTAPFVIGVNVRTGNGAYFRKGDRYSGRVDISLFDDPRAFLRLLERLCRRRLAGLPRPLRADFQIFYATDSEEMGALLAGLPNAVTRRQVFPPAGKGDLYAFDAPTYTDRDAIDDTLADMLLLARCDALVYNTSLFNQYARVLTGYFGGNHVHFESVLLRNRARHVAAALRRRLP